MVYCLLLSIFMVIKSEGEENSNKCDVVAMVADILVFVIIRKERVFTHKH